MRRYRVAGSARILPRLRVVSLPAPGLFHRHRLGQVARLVHVAPRANAALRGLPSSPSPRVPGMCSRARCTWAGSMNETIVFTTAEAASKRERHLLPIRRQEVLPTAEAFQQSPGGRYFGGREPAHLAARSIHFPKCASLASPFGSTKTQTFMGRPVRSGTLA